MVIPTILSNQIIMNKEKAYIEFESGDKHYVYDRFSNEFLQVENDLLVGGHIDEESIKRLQNENGILLPYSIPELSISKDRTLEEKISDKLNRNIVQLCFITTENCNLRCKYCVYSGAYKDMRTHNIKHEMSWSLTKNIVDFFLTRGSINTISFYGGESLIEYKLIKQVVEYVRGKNVNINFAMNTNLTLLTEDILDFLIKYQFAITISLDGPKEVHDLYRITKNNKPTHELVERNLIFIRKKNEEYFLNKVFYNVLIVPHPYDLDTVDRYFSGDLFNNVPLDSFRILTLNSTENDFATVTNYYEFLKRFQEYSRHLFVRRHIEGNTDFSDMKISYRYQVTRIKKIIFREMKNLDEYSFYWPNGICVLGLRSVIVNSTGVFYPCETLYDKQEMSIGNIRDGIDNKTVINYTKEYIDHGNKLCKYCWAFRFCAHCFTFAFDKNQYSMNKKLWECKMTKKGLLKDFKLFMEIYSQNSKAFDYLLEEEPYEKFSYMLTD